VSICTAPSARRVRNARRSNLWFESVSKILKYFFLLEVMIGVRYLAISFS